MKIVTVWLFFFSFFSGSFNAKAQVSLVGSWKLSSVKMINNSKDSIVIDLKNRDSATKVFIKAFKKDNIGQGEGLTDDEIKKEAVSMANRFYQIKIDLYSSHQFKMVSNGIIFPEAVPGWHFGKVIQGEWSSSNSSELSFKMAGIKNFDQKFKVLTLQSNSLTIVQSSEDETRSQEFAFLKK